MAGIGYNSKIIVYNQVGGRVGEPLIWFGIMLDSVRIEIREAVSVSAAGRRAENACTAKIHDSDLPVPYASPTAWRDLEDQLSAVTFESGKTFFIITDKADIGAEADAPAGRLPDADYTGGLIAYIGKQYGRVYEVNTADHYSLIPHWALGGK